MKIVKKPWGEERWFTDTPLYLGKVLIIHPHQRGSFHYHKKKHETMYIAEGNLLLVSDLEDDPIIIREGCALVIPPKTQHSLGAGPQRVVLFEASTNHPDDSVRVYDYYGRECDAGKDDPGQSRVLPRAKRGSQKANRGVARRSRAETQGR